MTEVLQVSMTDQLKPLVIDVKFRFVLDSIVKWLCFSTKGRGNLKQFSMRNNYSTCNFKTYLYYTMRIRTYVALFVCN